MTLEHRETTRVEALSASRNLDALLRREMPVGMQSGIHLRLDKIVGFELFNTRPFHNYETWSSGYRLLGPVEGDWTPWLEFSRIATNLGLDETATRALWDAASGSRSRVLQAEKEELGDAVATWLERRREVRSILAEAPPLPNHRTRLAVLGYHFPEGESARREEAPAQ
jgi:hypothetical protein